MTSTTPAPPDCHEAFPGSVRSHSWNSCPDCGGYLEAPVAVEPSPAIVITDRTVAAEARFVEEGHRAYLGHDETGPFVRVVSDTLGHRGIAYKVRAVASGPGQPLVFDCTPDGPVGLDGHRHLSRVDGRPTCKHAAGAARRMEREGLAELIPSGVHGSAVIRDSRWVATAKACPPPSPPTDDPFRGFPT